jgi:hypothetical protein
MVLFFKLSMLYNYQSEMELLDRYHELKNEDDISGPACFVQKTQPNVRVCGPPRTEPLQMYSLLA